MPTLRWMRQLSAFGSNIVENKLGNLEALTCVNISQCDYNKGSLIGVDINFIPFNEKSCIEIHEIAKISLQSSG